MQIAFIFIVATSAANAISHMLAAGKPIKSSTPIRSIAGIAIALTHIVAFWVLADGRYIVVPLIVTLVVGAYIIQLLMLAFSVEPTQTPSHRNDFIAPILSSLAMICAASMLYYASSPALLWTFGILTVPLFIGSVVASSKRTQKAFDEYPHKL